MLIMDAMGRPRKSSKKSSSINLLLLSVLAFLFVSTFAVSQIVPKKIYLAKSEKVKGEFDVSPVPEIISRDNFPEFSAQGVVALDVRSGISLYEKEADKKLLPASTTKIMTALVVIENYNLSSVITIPRVSVIGQKMGLVQGENITVNNLLYGLLVYSANDAAEALAASYGGGRQAFIDKMNEKALELHLENTHFSNPTGLEEENHYSSARDMVRLAEIAMQNKKFAQVVGTKEITVKSVNGNMVYNLKNINELLGTVPGVIGVKTGWTENARENLVTYVTRDGHDVIIALLGSQDRFGETRKLIEWIYSDYLWKELDPNSYSP